jgi:hypothetical protein
LIHRAWHRFFNRDVFSFNEPYKVMTNQLDASKTRKRSAARRDAAKSETPPIYGSLARVPDTLPGGFALLQLGAAVVQVTQRQIDAVRGIRRDPAGRIIERCQRDPYAVD